MSELELANKDQGDDETLPRARIASQDNLPTNKLQENKSKLISDVPMEEEVQIRKVKTSATKIDSLLVTEDAP